MGVRPPNRGVPPKGLAVCPENPCGLAYCSKPVARRDLILGEGVVGYKRQSFHRGNSLALGLLPQRYSNAVVDHQAEVLEKGQNLWRLLIALLDGLDYSHIRLE